MFRPLFALLATTLLLAPAATMTYAAPTHDVGDRLDRQVRDHMTTAVQPGMSAVVVKEGQVVLSRGYGFANRESGLPMSADTPIAIGSTSKGMTALAVMQLVEEGRVDLDAPVVDYVPDFTMGDDRYSRLTTRELLSMSSGLPAGTTLDGFQDPDGLQHHIAALSNARLHRDPGSGYEYANDGFNLAGLVVQRVSGEHYEQYIADHVFAPLGMDHSTFDPQQAADWGMAQGYAHHRGATVPLDTPLTRGNMPAGGVATTANDVARYLQALLNGGAREDARVLAPASVEAMWTPTLRTGDRMAVGLGWMLEDVDEHEGWTWTGDIGTSGSVFLVVPGEHLGVAVLANYDTPATLNQLAADLVAIAVGDEPATHSAPPDMTTVPIAEPDRSAWDQYPGLYRSERDAIRVERVDNKLTATVAGGDILAIASALGPNEGRSADLVPTSPTDFLMRGDTTVLDGIPVSFKVGADGRMMLMFGSSPRAVRDDTAE
jgi:CubicO group peptidase (beta-lactamase class C family)